MKPEPTRPDPDALVALLKKEEATASRGRFKVFLGMCPGVGKTYAMLRAARRVDAAGGGVVVGVVETHGRAETAAMAEGLPLVPRKRVEHRGAQLEEMDIDALLALRPKLVVVDELAHTNAPGSRHAKRWQDVVELLDAGIDVLTTVNIQHLESRADAVRHIAGVTVRETVPDSMLDLADEVELLDLTPEALLERLREGKVYLGEQAENAAGNFFQETNLNALRELALRFTAERVDKQLRELRSTRAKQTVWRSGERLLVAVGPSPFSTQLVRWTRRLAAAQGASWIAVHVENSRVLSPAEQKLLDDNLALARELGAEVVLTHDEDLPSALVRTALRHDATQIVIGKPRSSRLVDWLRGGSLVDRLLRLCGNIDIYLVPAESTSKGGRTAARRLSAPFRDGLKEYLLALGTLALVISLGLLLPVDAYLAVGLVILLSIVLLGLKVGRWPVLAAGMGGALLWNYLFIPPRFTFRINKVEDAVLFATYFVVAIVIGQLTARIRAQARNERMREERATALFDLTRSLAEAATLDDAIFAALRQIDRIFGVQSAILLADASWQGLVPHFAGSGAMEEKEKAVSAWAFQNRRIAGRGTDTLPGAKGVHVPLVREGRSLGVLVVFPQAGDLSLIQRDLLIAFSRQLGLSIERDHLQAASERERLLAQSEKLNRALFDSVSHELRTPLAVITGALENLQQKPGDNRDRLIAEACLASRRLNRLVANLLDQTRLESGALKPRLDWCDAGDVINAALEANEEALAGHPLELLIPPDLPLLFADFALLERALANLLLNAATHTAQSCPISLSAGTEDGFIFLCVADRGPGIAPEKKEKLFSKFSRGDSSRPGGLGLGLSIVRGFVVAQGGEVRCEDRPGGGVQFKILLPHKKPAEEITEP